MKVHLQRRIVYGKYEIDPKCALTLKVGQRRLRNFMSCWAYCCYYYKRGKQARLRELNCTDLKRESVFVDERMIGFGKGLMLLCCRLHFGNAQTRARLHVHYVPMSFRRGMPIGLLQHTQTLIAFVKALRCQVETPLLVSYACLH